LQYPLKAALQKDRAGRSGGFDAPVMAPLKKPYDAVARAGEAQGKSRRQPHGNQPRRFDLLIVYNLCYKGSDLLE